MQSRMQTYTLKHAIILDIRDAEGNQREEVRKSAGEVITVRRPKAKDLMVFDRFPGKPMGGISALLKRVVNLDEIEIDNLDSEDFDALGELASPGSVNGPPIGGAA